MAAQTAGGRGNWKFPGDRNWKFLRLAGWGAVAALLLTPLIAMQFTDEVDWTPFDFAFAGVLLVGVGLAAEVTVRKAASLAYRAAAGLALLAGLLLVWVTGAVGIIGSEANPANLMFAGVLAAAIVGTIAAGLRPRAMARAMAVTAALQALAGAIALIGGLGAEGASWPMDVALATVFFTGLWLMSGALFRQADRARGAAS